MKLELLALIDRASKMLHEEEGRISVNISLQGERTKEEAREIIESLAEYYESRWDGDGTGRFQGMVGSPEETVTINVYWRRC